MVLGDCQPMLIREAQVQEHLSMSKAIEAVESAFRDWAFGRAMNLPRQRVHTAQGTLHLMGASWHARGYIGYKAYFSFPSGTRFHFVLASAQSGEVLALFEADWLGRIRTGAASGVATKWMARPDAQTVAIIGTGDQARTQLEAVCAVRPIQAIRAYSRTPERRAQFAEVMETLLGIPVQPAESIEKAVDGADIVITITTAREPFLTGGMLRHGMHINAVGANSLARRELDTYAVARCERIAIDDPQQARIEAGELVLPTEQRRLGWERVIPLSQIVAGQMPGRLADEEITLFKSLGIALEDVAVASVVYEALKG